MQPIEATQIDVRLGLIASGQIGSDEAAKLYLEDVPDLQSQLSASRAENERLRELLAHARQHGTFDFACKMCWEITEALERKP